MSVTTPARTPEPDAASRRRWVPSWDVRTVTPVLGLIAVSVFFAVRSPAFLTVTNGRSLLISAAPLAITAAAMTIVILSGEIDLSVGPVASLTAIVFALTLGAGVPLVAAIGVTLLTGAFVGAVNGTLTAYGGIPSFIATLGMFSIADGISYLISGRSTVSITDLTFFAIFYDARPLGIPISGIYAIATLIAVGMLLRWTAFGRSVYAVGGNARAANMSGVSSARVKLQGFVLAGTLVAFAGLALGARLASGKPDAAPQLTLDAIAAVIIGGTSLMGGRGSVARTAVGVALIAVLTNGFGLLNIDTNVQFTIKGVIIVVAVLIDRLGSARS
ncbi:MAG: ABC transporter permease [Nitriliruptoraceae bacterium]|nr:ABC transporter permease [Nitriliruptoraceae bacterium]